MIKYDIWPSSKLPDSCPDVSVKEVVSDIEDFIRDYYGDKIYCVIFPSVRSALHHIMKYYNLGRSDRVYISEWSSHCVIETVGRLSIPLVGNDTTTESLNTFIINHQWGYMKYGQINMQRIIEDSCDSLVVSENSLFPNSGEFEVFSLPKIYGTIAGGICLTRDKKAALSLSDAKKNYNSAFSKKQYSLKRRFIETGDSVNLEYYSGTESINQMLDIEELFQIRSMIDKTKSIVDQRLYRIRELGLSTIVDMGGVSRQLYRYHFQNIFICCCKRKVMICRLGILTIQKERTLENMRK